MNHYTYLLTFNDGMLYVGVHSTHLDPELDVTYRGSGTELPVIRDESICTKTILALHDSREDAVNAEIQYILEHGCVESEHYYNQRLKTFDKYGQKAETHPNIRSMQSKLKGRTEDTHGYLRGTAQKLSNYCGENRTPAQKAADVRLSETTKGIPNSKKGHKGISNQAFTPWYFIDDLGNKTEVYDITKKDYASTLGLTPRQMEHRFHYTNIDKPKKSGILKGWIFGNL
jgi:predicted GIY-YIG superfamily endonuclease